MPDIKYENNKIDMAQFAPKDNKSIPNLISALRLLMLPVIVIVYLNGKPWLAAGLIVISGISDAVDGYIARHYNQTTTLGKVLDPLADKLTQFVLAIALCINYPVIIPLIVVLAVKELAMLYWGLRLLKAQQQPFSARWWGKLATAVYYVGAIIIVGFDRFISDSVISLISICITLVMLYSMFRYGLMFRAKMQGRIE